MKPSNCATTTLLLLSAVVSVTSFQTTQTVRATATTTQRTRLHTAFIQDAPTKNKGGRDDNMKHQSPLTAVVVQEDFAIVEPLSLDSSTIVAGGSSPVLKDPNNDSTIKARNKRASLTKATLAPGKLWKQRLNTLEDRKWFHKLSSIGFVLSSTVVVAEGFHNGFEQFPDWMGPWDLLLFTSTMFMSLSSIGMANSHRRSQTVSRNFFHATSWTQVSTAAVSQIFAPYEHSHLFVANKFLLNMNVGLPLILLGSYLINAIYHQYDLISTRLNVEESSDLDYLRTFLIYLFSPLVFIGVVWYYAFQVLDPSHDVAFLLQAAEESKGIGLTYYTQQMSLIGVGYIAFAVTLHDKKLISTRLESTIIGILSALVTAGNVGLMI